MLREDHHAEAHPLVLPDSLPLDYAKGTSTLPVTTPRWGTPLAMDCTTTVLTQ